jgi:hypothetical protein
MREDVWSEEKGATSARPARGEKSEKGPSR